MENKYYLDLWGGEHYITKEDGIYHIRRDCGLFSNITVMIYGILKFTINGYTPKGIELTLLEYDFYKEYYSELFYTSKESFYIDDIPKEDIDYSMKYCEPSMVGIGRKKSDHNYNILNRVNKKYFNINDTIINYIKEIEIANNINYDNTVFIWARKTDKDTEIPVPDAKKYIELYESLSLGDKEVILQTDDPRVIEDFQQFNFKFKVLNEIPLAKNVECGFHRKLCDVSDNAFYDMYNMTKKYYLQRILALVHVASKCNTLIVYPGNLATYIPIIRGNWDNVYSFYDNSNLIEN